MIYFARLKDRGPVKIGRAQNPENRLYYLRRDYRLPLEIIRIIEIRERWPEGWLHRHFLPYRVQGEWFTFQPAMMTIELPACPDCAPDWWFRPIRTGRTKGIGRDHCEEMRTIILAS